MASRIDHLLFADWLPQVNGPLSALLSTVANHENHVSIGASQIAGTLSATIVIPFQCPCTRIFFLSQKERGHGISSSSCGNCGKPTAARLKIGIDARFKKLSLWANCMVFHSFHRQLRNVLRHNPPDKARQFSCCRCFCYVSGRVGRNPEKLSPQPGIAAVCVCNHFPPVSFLLFL